jgi:hypothetical protein
MKNWFLRLFGIWIAILSLSWLAGCDGTFQQRDTCSSWQVRPELIGTWVNQAGSVTIEQDHGLRFNHDEERYAYAVCYLSGHDILMVNDEPLPYWTDGETLVLDGTVYVRQ